uniref:Phospholipid scramblase n=1 Tax=Mustela putorius furo TaxID=9669 RepID=M3YK63_MUSPF
MFKIKNENKKDIMKIRGPFVVSNCLQDLNFTLLSLDEEVVIGKISKGWPGFI